jgi:hypothetical protein
MPVNKVMGERLNGPSSCSQHSGHIESFQHPNKPVSINIHTVHTG